MGKTIPATMRRKREQPALRAEQQLLCQAVQEATRWLSEGEYSVGYRCLLAGLERAQEWEESGQPWGPELVSAWRTSLFEYAALYPSSQKVELTPRPAMPADIAAARNSSAIFSTSD